MEPNESQHHHHLSSYFTTTTPATTTPSPTNGLLPPPPNTTSDSGGGPHMVYPHSVGPSSASVTTAPVEPVRRKRGRPRKYGTPEQALAAKKTASSHSVSKEKREGASSSSPSYSGSSRKSQQLFALGGPCSFCFCTFIFLLWWCFVCLGIHFIFFLGFFLANLYLSL